MARRWCGKRYLLNGKGFQGTAAVVAEIEDTRRWKAGCDGDGEPIGTYAPEPDYILRFSDCDRAVTFILDFGSEAAHKNSLRKIDRMVDALVALRPALEQEQALHLERLAIADTNREARRETNNARTESAN